MIVDKDLEFLKDIDDEYLEIFIDVMSKYDSTNLKLTSIKLEHYRYGSAYVNYLDVITDAYLNYSKNVFSNMFGVKNNYRHILSDVCSRWNVAYNINLPIEKNEEKLLTTIFKNDIDSIDIDELIEMIVMIPGISKVPDIFILQMFAPPLLSILRSLICEPQQRVIMACTLLIALYRRRL